MVHESRRFSFVEVATAEDLAEKLTNHTWCCCNGFKYKDLFFLNDSFSPDGAQEFAVLQFKEPDIYEQIESITFGWCKQDEALKYINELFEGPRTLYARYHADSLTIQTAREHGRCGHCA